MTRRRLIVSDVDDTLLGNDEDLARFATWYERNRAHFRLVYASARFYESIAESVRQTRLPKPHAIIGGVGTDVRLHPSGRPIFAWEEMLDDCWDEGQVREVLAAYDRLEPQPTEFQSEFKVSYFLKNATGSELEQIRALLAEASIGAELIYSSCRDLDVLPAGCSKGTATKFLADYYEYETHEVIVCGDSANDLSMFEFGWRGVVVGNAHPELAALDSPLVYHSPASFASGVLDGLDYWLRRDKGRELTIAAASARL